MTRVCGSGGTTTDGAQPYFNVPAHALPDWQFKSAWLPTVSVLDLAVALSGGGDPGAGIYPADMLVDYVRVW